MLILRKFKLAFAFPMNPDEDNEGVGRVLEDNGGSDYNFKVRSLTTVKISKTSDSPSPRSGHRIVASDSDLIVVGGYSNHGDNSPCLFDELWKFNIARNGWERLVTKGPFPKELASHSVILLGDTLICYGGSGLPFGTSASNQVHMCNLKTLVWKIVETSGETPPALYGQAVYINNNSFYTIGGTDGVNYSIDIYRLDLPTLKWEAIFVSKGLAIDNEPKPRYRHELGFYDGKILLLGGGESSGIACFGYEMKEIHQFDIEKRNWIKTSTKSEHFVGGVECFPSPRLAHGCVQSGTDVWISGGRSHESLHKDIWKLHLPTLTWSIVKDLAYPFPVYFHTMAVTPSGCTYTFGGITDPYYKHRVNKLMKFWVKIPTLKEMAWETLLASYPNLPNVKSQVLIENGIPREFVERISTPKTEEDNVENTVGL